MNATRSRRTGITTVRLVLLLLVASCLGGTANAAAVDVRHDPASGQFDFIEGSNPVLRYNFRAVEPGELLGKVAPANKIYARPRSDYIHPLFGLNAEVLTYDWPIDHPHHRGIYWAWPEVDFGTNRGDLHALQKVFARPTGKTWTIRGARFAQLEAENLWLWDDRDAIVREQVIIRAYDGNLQRRVIDLAFRFVPLKEGVSVARRGMAHYGGLNLRLATPASQEITTHTDPTNAMPQRAWSDVSGVFGAGPAPSGVTLLQHGQNPDYPGDWVQYPNLSWCQPAFPAAGTRYTLRRDQPLVLRYRLIIHAGAKPKEADAAQWWDEFNAPAAARPTFHP